MTPPAAVSASRNEVRAPRLIELTEPEQASEEKKA